MAEFSIELRARVAQVRQDLSSAHDLGEDSLAEAWAGELESLVRIARDHHIELEPEVPAAPAVAG